MSKSIIEKLGITPGPWWCGFMSTTVKCKKGHPLKIKEPVADADFPHKRRDEGFLNAKLIAAAPEMLEALIGYCVNYESNKDINNALSRAWYELFKQIIEKALPHINGGWPKIKELIK